MVLLTQSFISVKISLEHTTQRIDSPFLLLTKPAEAETIEDFRESASTVACLSSSATSKTCCLSGEVTPEEDPLGDPWAPSEADEAVGGDDGGEGEVTAEVTGEVTEADHFETGELSSVGGGD